MRLPALASLLLAGAALSACTPRAELAPATATASAAASFETRLGESSNLGGRTVTPLAVVEDSRCPSGAQCIQAGTARLQVRVERAARSEVVTVGLGSPVKTGGTWLHLAGLCPHPELSRPIAPWDYRITLAVSDGPDLPAAPIACPAR